MAEKKIGKRLVILGVLTVIAAFGAWYGFRLTKQYGGKSAWVYIPAGSTRDAAEDSIKSALGNGFGGIVAGLWNGDVTASHGAYLIEKGDRAWRVARRIGQGRQTPVKVTFNNARTKEDVAEKISGRMEFSQEDFLEAMKRIEAKDSIGERELAVEFLPDTYEVYWTAGAEDVIGKMRGHYENVWNTERREKAAKLGLSPKEVSVLASIVEEESSKRDEYGKIARLYLNRLHKGMLLQADPTVKFANGDFAAKRITGDMLGVDSPYNTYRYKGLPPGIIRFPDVRTIDAVLNAQEHNYLYMCARADLSGYHDFTSDYKAHLANGAAFRKAAYGK